MDKRQIQVYFDKKYNLHPEQKLYLQIHSKRFEMILSMIAETHSPFLKVLDIGPSFMSELLYKQFGNKLSLMGFIPKEGMMEGHLPDNKIAENIQFISQDLNDWKVDEVSEKYDLIICTEVLEHLYTSPTRLFSNLHHSLSNNGILILQTPNAASLKKRIKLLMGNNPYEIPRENLSNPGHYREYTLSELKDFALQTNFRVEMAKIGEYFEYPSLRSKIYRSFSFLIPQKLRSGITLILKK